MLYDVNKRRNFYLKTKYIKVHNCTEVRILITGNKLHLHINIGSYE